MAMRLFSSVALALLLSGSLTGASAETPFPGAIAAPGETVVLSTHAQGSQVYVCKSNADGELVWTFSEPLAALTVDGRVVGRHYAGPTWEHIDGSAVVGKVAASAPGAAAGDIAWLKLEVVSHRGNGVLTDVTTVQRIHTLGGKLEGVCEKAGNSLSMPYAADYVFLRKG
jgi:Protein of unknown function (DUF3455)